MIRNKFELVRSVVKRPIKYQGDIRPNLLDVGCRGCELKPYVAEYVDYNGVDLFQNNEGSVTYVQDVSKGIPVANESYDYVVALDLLEHLDNMEAGLLELCRISKNSILIMLPNNAHFLLRLRFALTGRISEKYRVSYNAGKDRHRWFTTQVDCDKFVSDFAAANKLTLSTMCFVDSKKKELFGRFCKLIGLKRNLWAWATFYELKKAR